MKRATLSLAAPILLLGSVGQAKADFLAYDNGAINGTGGGLTISSVGSAAFSVSDSFTVTGPTILTGAQHVGIWVPHPATPFTLQWSIGTSRFSSDISAGSASLSSTFHNDANFGVDDVYDASFTLNGTVTNGTTYWLTLSNATSDGNFVAWDVNSGPSQASQRDNSGNQYNVPSESFQLTGNAPSAVPEPASLTMVGIGAVSLMGYAWRRHKKVAPQLAA